MVVELFNLSYFIPIIIGTVITVVLYFIFKDKAIKTKRNVVIVMLFLNLALHFMKLLFIPYRLNMPNSFRNITFENICAVSTLLFPFLFLTKHRIFKDYIFYVGLLGGLAALIYPTEALHKELLTFDVIRFYFTHLTLFIAPLLMVIFKVHHLQYKKIWQSVVTLLLVLVVIMLNEIMLSLFGLSDLTRLLHRNYRNNSFVYGPTPEFDSFAAKVFDPLVPKFLRTNYFGLDVDKFYFPVLWLFFPAFIYFTPIFLLFSLPFTFHEIRRDLRKRLKREHAFEH